VVAGLDRFQQYTYGNLVKVENALRLNKYNVTFQYVNGTDLNIADTLSRAICDEQDFHDIEHNIINHVDIRDSLVEEIKTKTAED